MATEGRTWAQIAAGLPASEPNPATSEEGQKDPSCANAKASKQEPGIPSVAEDMPCSIAALKTQNEMQGDSLAEAAPEEPRVAESEVGAEGKLLQEASATELDSTVSAAIVEGTCEESDESTAVASDEGTDDCALCNGTGLLHAGVLTDPCPLCEQLEENNSKEKSGGQTVSDDSSCSPLSEAGSDQNAKEDCQSRTGPVTEDIKAVPKDGMAIIAPPGLGPPPKPPGVWIWPHGSKNEAEDTDSTAPETNRKDEKDGQIDWPATPSGSAEIEFVGKAAQTCFGADFIKMTLTWITPYDQANYSMSAAEVQLHLKPNPKVDFMAPLARLQNIMARDAQSHECSLFGMERSKDDTLMHVTCSRVSHNTCWDIVKNGYCPRLGRCTWEHPLPVFVNVSVAGQKPTQPTLLSTLMSKGKDQINEGATDKTLLSKESSPFQPSGLPAESPTLQPSVPPAGQNQVALNIGAYDELDDSSDED